EEPVAVGRGGTIAVPESDVGSLRLAGGHEAEPILTAAETAWPPGVMAFDRSEPLPDPAATTAAPIARAPEITARLGARPAPTGLVWLRAAGYRAGGAGSRSTGTAPPELRATSGAVTALMRAATDGGGSSGATLSGRDVAPSPAPSPTPTGSQA